MPAPLVPSLAMRQWVELTSQAELDEDARRLEHLFNEQYRYETGLKDRPRYLSLRSLSSVCLMSVRLERATDGGPKWICVARAYRDPRPDYAHDLDILAKHLGYGGAPVNCYPFPEIEAAFREVDVILPEIATAAVAAGYLPVRLSTWDPYLPLASLMLTVSDNRQVQQVGVDIGKDGSVKFTTIAPQLKKIATYTVKDAGLAVLARESRIHYPSRGALDRVLTTA